jgi:acyl dehydratase
MIQRFVQAVDDPNPLWQDEGYAKKSKYGSIIAPPTLIPVIGFGQNQYMSASDSSETLLHGGTELESYQPVRPGDVITVTTKIADVRERRSQERGRMVFMTLDMAYENQRQELVARCRQKLISYRQD